MYPQGGTQHMIHMIKRACEQQPAIAAVLYRRRDLTHLELSSSEWRLLEDVSEELEPYKDVTTYLISESYPTISHFTLPFKLS